MAPTWFMENVIIPWYLSDIAQGKWRQSMPAGVPLQMVAAADIGRSAAAVMQRPDDFIGKRLELVGDTLTGEQMAAVLSKAVGREIRFEEQPIDELAPMGQDMIDMMQWLVQTGYSADAELLARELPEVELVDFESWAKSQDWAALLEGVAVPA